MCWFVRKFPLLKEDIDPMIRGHEITLELAKSPQLADVLNDLNDSPDLRRSMREDPASYLRSRGVKIPNGASVAMRLLEANGWEIEVKVVEGLYAYTNGFNNETGFYRIQ